MALSVLIPAAEREIGCRLREIDTDFLEGLVERRVAESASVDFKREFKGSSAEGSRELCKDICAFANAQGGLLIVGIEDVDGVAARLSPIDLPAGELRDRLAQIVHAHVQPAPAFDLAIFPATEVGKVFIVIAVPASRDSPHAVIRRDRSDPWLQFPVRYETTTRFMDHVEISRAYAARNLTASDRSERLRALSESEPIFPSHLVIGAVVVPVNVGRLDIDEHVAIRVRESIDRRSKDRQGSLGIDLKTAVVMSEFIPAAIRIHLDSGRLEAHSDGAVHGLLLSDPFVSPSLGRVQSRPAGLPDERVVASLFYLLGLLGDISRSGAGCVGEALLKVTARATWPDGTPRDLGLISASSSAARERRRMIGNACSAVEYETTVSLEDLAGDTKRLLETVQWVCSAVCQHFGLSGTDLVSRNGVVSSDSFSIEHRPAVEAWNAREIDQSGIGAWS